MSFWRSIKGFSGIDRFLILLVRWFLNRCLGGMYRNQHPIILIRCLGADRVATFIYAIQMSLSFAASCEGTCRQEAIRRERGTR